jgi:hypothetical protein
VRAFLRSHTDFLERFVMEEVELEILERWMIRRMQRAKKRLDAPSTGRYSNKPSFASASLKYFCFNSGEKCQRIFHRPTIHCKFFALTRVMVSVISSDGVNWQSSGI